MNAIAKEDPQIEDRINMEIIVDAYGEEEQSGAWYNYLDQNLKVPFMARCTAKRQNYPLKVGEEVQVTGKASDDYCRHEMLVKIIWKKRSLAIPLSQLEPIQSDEETTRVVRDWQYWVNRGYQL
jgi:hypothetical protein